MLPTHDVANDGFSAELDALVPPRRRHARAVHMKVHYEDSTNIVAIILVRVKYQLGGGAHYYRLCAIEDIREFYPYHMGRAVVEDVLTRWVELQMRSPPPATPKPWVY
jgi:hypothetical protein